MLHLLALASLACAAVGVNAADPQPIPLWPGNAPADAAQEQSIVRKHENREILWVSNVRWSTLTVYPAAADKNTGAAVIICPGGGYGGLAYDMEGTEVAERFAANGVTGIVLKYRMPRATETKGQVPWPIQDGQRAIQTIRARAAEWKIDPARIGILGFSAGGHLAATVSTHVVAADANATDAVLKVSSRPDFSVLIYPVVTFDPTVGHTGSANALIGKNADPELVKLYSNDLQVTAGTPPAFLVHAADDGVKVANSDLYDAALTKAGVPHEFMRLEKGGHGFGMGIKGGEPATWPERCLAWMGKQGLLGKP
ncbi:MAG: alpha/beta hydrolase [Planctomycetes bacterium]|nr:alpha/beta hydrolase [Planctomycetota bacterium]